MILHKGLVYRTEQQRFEAMDVWVKNEKIQGVGAPGAFDQIDDERVDVTGYWLVPGLVDVHTHGRTGYDFISCSEEKLGIMAADYARQGVTTVMPTLETASYDRMLAATDQLNRFVPKQDQASFCGVHWEGRYLNPAKKGAHDEGLLAMPRAAELDSEILRGCRKLHVSVALELDEDGSFAKAAQEMGATLGLAHTAATYAEAKRAEEMGIVSYTHLFNAMPSLHHRDGGAVCAALEGDRIAELISDGIHIAPEMIRLVYRNKGVEQISLVSDSMSAAGCADGTYKVCGMSVTVKDGIARNDASGVLAGSTLSLNTAVNRFAEFSGIPLSRALVSATATPAKQVGIYDVVGSIDKGKQADVLLLQTPDRLMPARILLRGKWLTP